MESKDSAAVAAVCGFRAMFVGEMTSTPNSVLITGAAGQLGKRLLSCAERRASLTVVGLDHDDLDVCNRDAVIKAIACYQPSVVIHTAAFTDVDRAESEVSQASKVNASAVRNVAEACRDSGASLIHISTDYVFGHGPRRPLTPADPTAPKTAYGRTKLSGEKEFLDSCVAGAIVRVAWLYDTEGRNFMNTMLQLAAIHGELKVVDDQFGIPTAAPVFADALLDMAERGTNMPQGVWHFAHAGHPTTWHGFATKIMELAGLDVPVERVATEAFPTPANRPSWSVLDGEPLRDIMGWPTETWIDALAQVWALKQACG